MLEFGSSIFYTNFSIFVIALSILNPVGHLLIIIAVHWKSCSGWSLKASIKLMRAALVPSIGALVNFQSITKTKQDFFELANKQLNVTLESIKFHIFLVDQLKGGRANVGTSTTIESGNSSQTIGYTVQTLRTLPEIILGKLQVLTDFPASYTSFQFLLLATTAIQSQHRVDFPEPLGPMSQIILLSLFYNFVFKLDQQGMTLLRFPEVVISKFQELINYFNKKKFILYYKFILLNQENKMDILILIKIIIIFFVNIFSYLIIKHFPANIDLPFYLFHKKMDHYRLFRVNRVRRAEDAPGNEEHYKHPTYKQILEEMRNQNFDLQNKSNIDQLCEDCQNDCYDQIHSQYLLYLFSRLFPEDSACLYQNKKYKIRPCSINYSFRRCQSGTYHLWINGKRVLMCKEAYRIVQSIHGHQHRLPIIIKTRIQTDYNVYYDTIADFVEQFPYQCQYCAANLPKMKLNSPIWKQLYKKASNQQFLSLQQQIICSKKYNLYDCQTRLCKTDQYENKFEQARYCFLYKNFPPQKQTESDSSYQRRVQKLLKLVKKLDVRQCSQGTYHLWIYQANKRVPMKKQKQLIAQYLHGEQHLNYEEMVNKLREIREIYAQDLETSIKNIIRNCQKCHMFPKLKLKVQSRSADNLPKQQQPLSYLFDRIEPFNPEKQTEFVFLKRVKQLIQNFPFPSNISQYYDELKSSFKIPDRIMQVIQKQEFWVKKSSQQIIKFLQAHDIHIKTLTQQHQNQVTQYKGFIIYTDQMKCNYQLYGDTINFDFIDQVVKMRTFTGQYYLAILMTGLDQNFSNVLFGVCLIEGSEVINHRQVYELFFQQMGGYMPFNIVTGNNIYAQSAIKSLIKSKNLDIEYYINWFWVIDKLKIWTSKQQDKKRLMETMTSLLIETKAQGYKEKISQIKSIIGNRKTLNDFDLNRDKYCLCMAKKPKLMVYSMSTTKTKEFLDLFQRSVVKDRGLGQFVLHILELQKKLQLERIEKKKQNREKQGQIVKEQLGKDIQEKLCLILNKYGRIISSEMRQLYIKSLKQVKQLIPFHSYEVQINLISNSSHKIEKSDRQSNEEKNNMYGYHVISSPAQNTLNQCKVINSVRYLVEDDHWECSCRFQYAAGLPCHHLLPILSTFSASIQYYICQKWLNLHHDSNQYQLFPIQENHQLHKCKQQVKRASRQLVIDFSDLLKPKYQQNLFNFKHQYFNQATLFQKVYNRVKNNLALRSEMKKQRQNIHQNGENYDISNQIADQMSYSYESHNQNWMSHT